jgi:aldehyde dehydrogenase (NAD+)
LHRTQPNVVVGITITGNGSLISLAMKIPAALTAGNTAVVERCDLTLSGDVVTEVEPTLRSPRVRSSARCSR